MTDVIVYLAGPVLSAVITWQLVIRTLPGAIRRLDEQVNHTEAGHHD